MSIMNKILTSGLEDTADDIVSKSIRKIVSSKGDDAIRKAATKIPVSYMDDVAQDVAVKRIPALTYGDALVENNIAKNIEASSKFLQPKGPLTLYHGTPNKFEDFDESLPSVWFSDSDKNLRDTGLSIKGNQPMNVMKRQLPKDLMIADEDLADRLTKQQLQDRGYAGIAYTERGPNGDETYYEIFNPNKTLRKMPDVMQSKGPSLVEMARNIKAMRASRNMAEDGIRRIGSANVVPIDPNTLPAGYSDFVEFNTTPTHKYVEKAIGGNLYDVSNIPKLEKFIEDEGYELRPNFADNIQTANDIIKDQVMERLDMEGSPYSKFLQVYDRLQKDNPGAKVGPRWHSISAEGDKAPMQTQAAKLDMEYSDRLGIGRSHTPMNDNALGPNARGAYMAGGIGIDPYYATGETGVSTAAHERMHAWQDANSGWDSRVTDAIGELRDELKNFYHDKPTIKEYRGNNYDIDYYLDPKEQEARMLQSYLDNEGFTKTYKRTSEKGTEWGNEIKPAFDKFFDKLRALSKAGVALPAALLAVLALSSGDNDNKS